VQICDLQASEFWKNWTSINQPPTAFVQFQREKRREGGENIRSWGFSGFDAIPRVAARPSEPKLESQPPQAGEAAGKQLIGHGSTSDDLFKGRVSPTPSGTGEALHPRCGHA
jgi:hypothetical protein